MLRATSTILMAAVLITFSAAVAAVDLTRHLQFDIAPQSLSTALVQFSGQAGMQFTAPGTPLAGVATGGVRGEYSVDAALSVLLKDTGFTYRIVDEGTVAIQSMMSSPQAGAQQAPVEAAQGRSEDQSDSPSAGSGLEEVFVTARRVEERLQSVPVAVTVISVETMERQRIDTATDLARFVPTLYVGGADRDNQSFNLRGIGNTGGGPGVVNYLNEVPDLGPAVASGFASGGGTGPGLYYDLDAVQVLKGPQGTLFGQNTLGGAILLSSKKPADRFEGYLQAQLGNHQDQELQGAASIPLIADVLSIRVAGAMARRDGFTQALASRTDLDDKHYDAGRLSLLFTPGEALSSYLVVNAVKVDQHGTGRILTALNPAFNGTFNFLYGPGNLQAALAQQQALGPRHSVGEFDPALDAEPLFKQRHLSISDSTTLKLGDDLVLKNIVAYQRLKYLSRQDFDGSIYPVIDLVAPDGAWNAQLRQWTEELQLQGKSFADKLQWTVGGFYLDLRPFGLQQDRQYAFERAGVTDNPTVSTNASRASSYAFYAQGTYDLAALLEGLKVTAGYRYTWDERIGEQTSKRLSTNVCTSPKAVAPDCRLTGEGAYSAPAWTASLDYQIVPDTLVYLATRRGYVSGGLNLASPIPGTETFDIATLTDVELGIKSDWSVGSVPVRTNVALFYANFDGIPTTTYITSPTTGAAVAVVQNNATAKRKGVEVEASIIPFNGFTVDLSYSHLDAYYTKYDAVGVVVKQPQIFGAPENKAMVAARYLLPINEALGQVTVSAGWTYQTRFANTTTPALSPGLFQPAYSLLNLAADWNSVIGRPVDLSVFMTNVTDKVYDLGGASVYTSAGFNFGTFGEPRMYGARLKYRF